MKIFPRRLPPTDESCIYLYLCRATYLLPHFHRCSVVADEPPHLTTGTWYQLVWLRLAINLYIASR